MVAQSRAVPVILTRPAAQSARFARDLHQRFGNAVEVCESPLLAPRFLQPRLGSGPWKAVVFTSETAVTATTALGADRDRLPRQAYCVGDRTAEAARAAGFVALSAKGNAATLCAFVRANGEAGPLLHLHGEETIGEVAETLRRAGIETNEAVIYVQEAQPLTPSALARLNDTAPVILPIFSPRTATLLTTQLAGLPRQAPLFVVAISAAVGRSFGDLERGHLIVADSPDGPAVLAAVERALMRAQAA